MLDRHLHPRIKPLLHQCVRVLDKPGITPDGLTLVGFAIGVLALPFLALGWCTPEEALQYPLAPADIPLLEAFMALRAARPAD